MTKTTSCWLPYIAFLGAIAVLSFDIVEAFGTSVVYSPSTSAIELVLLTTKLVAKEGQESFCICGPGQESKATKMMYGNTDDEENTILGKPISSGDDMQDALSKVNTLFLVCYDNPIEEKALNTLLNTAGTDLSKVVMLSKMGATAGGGGGFFGGGSKLLDSENKVRSLCKSKNLELSIVRAGVLKGGGPGEPADLDYGLSKTYYNTLFELSEATCTMSHDRFTLGVDCTKGDSVEMPNPITLFGTKTSFDPYPYDTNRINAAMACVMAAKHDKPVELSVGSAKGEELPSKEEWGEIMEKMEV
eukprot:CAMPEP_0116138552 /NCGR_PEP_ID=MMETSP0329-20121206/12841_1 /TAXON_ID=697910 /ORGANISM="Pseudo-nitzschia arenysensis, Strain B593" /LENGTH=302 /DNA_ID=CAMNT_0003633539 /DNA_START=56 /DNA_END=964 /DNA_ORIENTATION=+